MLQIAVNKRNVSAGRKIYTFIGFITPFNYKPPLVESTFIIFVTFMWPGNQHGMRKPFWRLWLTSKFQSRNNVLKAFAASQLTSRNPQLCDYSRANSSACWKAFLICFLILDSGCCVAKVHLDADQINKTQETKELSSMKLCLQTNEGWPCWAFLYTYCPNSVSSCT